RRERARSDGRSGRRGRCRSPGRYAIARRRSPPAWTGRPARRRGGGRGDALRPGGWRRPRRDRSFRWSSFPRGGLDQAAAIGAGEEAFGAKSPLSPFPRTPGEGHAQHPPADGLHGEEPAHGIAPPLGEVAVVAEDEDVALGNGPRPRRQGERAAGSERGMRALLHLLDPDAARARVPEIQVAAVAPVLQALLEQPAPQGLAVDADHAIHDLDGLSRKADHPLDGLALAV